MTTTDERPARLEVSVCRRQITLLAVVGIAHAATWITVLAMARPEPAEAGQATVQVMAQANPDVRPTDLDRVESRTTANATDIVLNRVAIAQMGERLINIDRSVTDLSQKFNWVMAGLISVLLSVIGSLVALVWSIWKGWLSVKQAGV